MTFIEKLRLPEVAGVLFVLLLTFLFFYPALNADFTNWDDNILVTGNKDIQHLSFDSVKKFFTQFKLNHYHPLVLLTYAIEYALVGLSAFHFHLTNLILHLANVLLAYCIAKKITQNVAAAFLTALLFGIHPLRVESVVWIAERKDVLSTFFMFISFYWYISYREKEKASALFLAFITMLCALLSKAMAVVLPVMFLLYSFYLYGIVSKKRVTELFPFFALSLLFGIVAIASQYSTGVSPKDPKFNILSSLFLGTHSILYYLLKFFIPHQLLPVHPYPNVSGQPYSVLYWIAPIIVAIIVYLIFRYRRGDRLLIFGLLFYVLTLLPVSQIIPVGRMMVADRFSYLPLYGIMLIVGKELSIFFETQNKKKLVGLVSLLLPIILFLGFKTQQQISVWMSSVSLWNNVVTNYPLYAEGHNNLAISYAEKGDTEKALFYFEKAITLEPDEAQYYYNRGLLFLNVKKYEKAVDDFTATLTLEPNNLFAFMLRGDAEYEQGNYQKAIDDYNIILKEFPNVIDVRIKRLKTYCVLGMTDKVQEEKQNLLNLNVHVNIDSLKHH